MIDHRTITLANGLRVVAVNIPALHSAELALYVKVGGRNDPPGKEGLAHFLEHMLFRGTSDYPTSTEIETAFELLGGSVNASTDEESTCFFTRIHPDHVGEALAILASMLLRPLLSDLEIEKKIITEEALDDLNENGDEINPHNLACRLLWPDHPLGRPTIGTLATIAGFSLEDLHRHLAEFYRPGNALLVAAGRFDRPQFFAAADEYLGGWAAGDVAATLPPTERQTEPQSIFVADADSQAHLQISFRSFRRCDERLMALRLLRRILCGSGSARLHLNLRERLGIAYSIDANIAAYDETGYFSIELSTGGENLCLAVREILREVADLARQPVKAAELERVQKIYFYELDYSRDSCFEMQLRYGWGELMGVVREIDDDYRQAADLTPEQLRTVAAELFAPHNLNLVVVGAWKEKDRTAIERELANYRESWQ